jgi:glycosidase
MALLWTCLAAQEVRLLNVSMQKRFSIHPDSAWVNYIRCHDDIGWTFDDTDAQELHIHPFYHRQWLNEFYSGRFPGSFASGLLFQENPKTGDARISGTAASLAGLEKALTENDETLVEMAVRRILLMHGIILTIGGIPLIYLGDEIGQLNDNAFLKDPQKAKDSRWLHRPKMTWEKTGLRLSKKTVQGRIFRGLMKRIEIRKENPVFTGGAMEVIQTGNDHIFAFTREYKRERCAVLTNFSSSDQEIPASLFAEMSFKGKITELITDVQIPAGQNYVMGPYEQIIII